MHSTLILSAQSLWNTVTRLAKHSVDLVTKPFWKDGGKLTIGEDLLLCGVRIVVPKAM